MTTIETLTDEQIKALGTESGQAGDIHMAAICAKAAGRDYDQYDLTQDERAKVDAMSADAARVQVVRVIRDAEAQAE